MKLRALASTLLAPVFLLQLACGGSSPEPAAPAEPAPSEPAVEPAPSEPATAEPTPTEPAPTEPAAQEGNGRLAFITCEEPRKSACTKEYRPVCAEVDTGIRCIKAPCPSSEKKQFGNGCSACADAKVIGYFPAACTDLESGKAP